jgi:hypothetical protein
MHLNLEFITPHLAPYYLWDRRVRGWIPMPVTFTPKAIVGTPYRGNRPKHSPKTNQWPHYMPEHSLAHPNLDLEWLESLKKRDSLWWSLSTTKILSGGSLLGYEFSRRVITCVLPYLDYVRNSLVTPNFPKILRYFLISWMLLLRCNRIKLPVLLLPMGKNG